VWYLYTLEADKTSKFPSQDSSTAAVNQSISWSFHYQLKKPILQESEWFFFYLSFFFVRVIFAHFLSSPRSQIYSWNPFSQPCLTNRQTETETWLEATFSLFYAGSLCYLYHFFLYLYRWNVYFKDELTLRQEFERILDSFPLTPSKFLPRIVTHPLFRESCGTDCRQETKSLQKRIESEIMNCLHHKDLKQLDRRPWILTVLALPTEIELLNNCNYYVVILLF